MKKVRSNRQSGKPTHFDVRSWLTTADAYALIKQFAREFQGLAKIPTDDLTSEYVVLLLERELDAPADETAFLAWFKELARETAVRFHYAAKEQERGYGRTDMAEDEADVIDGAVDPDSLPDGEPEFVYCSEVVAREESMRTRVEDALAKLSKEQRAAVKARFFRPTNLAEVSKSQGMGDSTLRMRLLRAKTRLATLIDRDAFALAV